MRNFGARNCHWDSMFTSAPDEENDPYDWRLLTCTT